MFYILEICSLTSPATALLGRLMFVLIVIGPPNITLRDNCHLREDLPQTRLTLPRENGGREVLDRLVQQHCQGGRIHSGSSKKAGKYSDCYCEKYSLQKIQGTLKNN